MININDKVKKEEEEGLTPEQMLKEALGESRPEIRTMALFGDVDEVSSCIMWQ